MAAFYSRRVSDRAGNAVPGVLVQVFAIETGDPVPVFSTPDLEGDPIAQLQSDDLGYYQFYAAQVVARIVHSKGGASTTYEPVALIDLELLKFPQPISAGGTGATSQQGARDALGVTAIVTDLQAQLDVLNHVPMDITALTNTVNAVELGSVVNAITFNWTRNKAAAVQSFNQGIGAIDNTVLTVTEAVNINATTTYTLTADDGTDFDGHADTASTTVSFLNRMYYGTSAAAGLDNAGILALANKPLTATRARTYSQDGGGQYLYLAIPVSFGEPNIVIDGFSVAWIKTTVNAMTNASGYTTAYNVYRSPSVQNGTGINVSVS